MSRGERNLMLLFFVISGGATLIAFSFDRPEARLFPLATGAVTSFLILAYFFILRTTALRQKLHAYIEDDIFMKIAAAADSLPESEAAEAAEATHETAGLPEEIRVSREKAVFSYLGGFLFIAWFAGLAVASPALLLALMVGYSKKSWGLALIVTAATSVFMYLVFVVVLRLPLEFGVLEGVL